jgi:lipopolysaccharide/colanic/teichoic acid biosynthesis glycosyltransferase
MYAKCFKRVIDFTLSLIALIILFPVLLILTVIGAIAMKGNPFFTQLRPGKIDRKTGKERIFRLIKFRTMTCEKDANGVLLPDKQRLNKYGTFLRNSSLDELPELLNILMGQMSIVEPRPLLVKYLPLYNDYQRQRHTVRPGLTGLAQVKGRNNFSWEQRFELDVEYVRKVTLLSDIRIILGTAVKVFKREGISSETCTQYTMAEFTGSKNHE